MPKLEHEVSIASPAHRVWEVVSDLGKVDMWSSTAVEKLDPTRMCVVCGGSPHELPFGPDAMVRMDQWDEGERIGYRVTSVEDVKSMRIDISVRPKGDGAAVTFAFDFEVDDGVTDRSAVERRFDQSPVESLACLKRCAEMG